VLRRINSNPGLFLTYIAHYREDIVVALECMFTCKAAGRPPCSLEQGDLDGWFTQN
jgi:hypothetical protein